MLRNFQLQPYGGNSNVPLVIFMVALQRECQGKWYFIYEVLPSTRPRCFIIIQKDWTNKQLVDNSEHSFANGAEVEDIHADFLQEEGLFILPSDYNAVSCWETFRNQRRVSCDTCPQFRRFFFDVSLHPLFTISLETTSTQRVSTKLFCDADRLLCPPSKHCFSFKPLENQTKHWNENVIETYLVPCLTWTWCGKWGKQSVSPSG